MVLSSPTNANEMTNDNGCVVLLHGLARSAWSMKKIANRLKNDYRVINNTYPSRKYSISELADRAIKPALKQCNQETVHFVTHSLGGILVRDYFHRHAQQKLGRVVMLGPPNQGSELVDYFSRIGLFTTVNGPAGLQLGTDKKSAPIKLGAVNFELGVIAGTCSFNPLYSKVISGDDDGKVSVERTKVEGMRDHLIMDVNHSFMMRDENVIKQIQHFLQHGIFQRPA